MRRVNPIRIYDFPQIIFLHFFKIAEKRFDIRRKIKAVKVLFVGFAEYAHVLEKLQAFGFPSKQRIQGKQFSEDAADCENINAVVIGVAA